MSRSAAILMMVCSLAVAVASQKPSCEEQRGVVDDRLQRLTQLSGSEYEGGLRKLLRVFLDDCDNPSLSSKYREELDELSEHAASSSLHIAEYYIKKNREDPEHYHLKGAMARLKSIRETYPKFSRMDEVVFLLGRLYLRQGDLDESELYLDELRDKYPASTRSALALRYLSQIAAMRLKQ